MLEKFKSRKLWISVIGAALIAANEQLSLKWSPESILSLTGIVISYIFAQAGIDKKL